MLKLKVKAMIFDLDGVITDTMPYHFRAWKEVYRKEGFRMAKNEVYLREGQPGYVTIKEIAEKYHFPSFSEAKIKEILDKKEKLFKKIVRRRFIIGSRRFLYFLKKRGFVLALVTGTARHEVERILPKELLGLFSVTITGNDVKKGKPHPEPYLIALKRLQMRPKDVVVFENAPFGIISAKRAHLRCLALETYLPKTYLKRADFVFSSFQELCHRVHFIASGND